MVNKHPSHLPASRWVRFGEETPTARQVRMMSSLSEAGQKPKKTPIKSIFWLGKDTMPETDHIASDQRVGAAP